MNERIDNLLYQAGLTAQGCWDELGTYEQEAIEKFAELIVRECADVAKRWTPETEECEYTWLIHDKIKEHFGVEE